MLKKSSAMPVKAIKQYLRHYTSLPYNQWVWNSELVGVLLRESLLYPLPASKRQYCLGQTICQIVLILDGFRGHCMSKHGRCPSRQGRFSSKKHRQKWNFPQTLHLFFYFPESVRSAVLCVTTQTRQWLALLIVGAGVKWQAGEMGSKSHAPQSVFCLFQKHVKWLKLQMYSQQNICYWNRCNISWLFQREASSVPTATMHSIWELG